MSEMKQVALVAGLCWLFVLAAMVLAGSRALKCSDAPDPTATADATGQAGESPTDECPECFALTTPGRSVAHQAWHDKMTP